ncbi:hypothetical protein LZ30DRAFT_687017 [Colletotrichum cereale]|nr:hypothetical protein LZ30DRAFT_687017 [Colletotrichum cereale]
MSCTSRYADADSRLHVGLFVNESFIAQESLWRLKPQLRTVPTCTLPWSHQRRLTGRVRAGLCDVPVLMWAILIAVTPSDPVTRGVVFFNEQEESGGREGIRGAGAAQTELALYRGPSCWLMGELPKNK